MSATEGAHAAQARRNVATRRVLNRELAAKVYEMMREQHYKAGGYGFEPPVADIQGAGSIEEAQKIQSESFTRYTYAAMDTLRGMAEIVALIEQTTPEKVLEKVRR